MAHTEVAVIVDHLCSFNELFLIHWFLKLMGFSCIVLEMPMCMNSAVEIEMTRHVTIND